MYYVGKPRRQGFSRQRPFHLCLLFEAAAYLCFQLDFWRWPALGRTADVMVAPDSAAKAEKVLDDAGIEYQVSTLDVQR